MARRADRQGDTTFFGGPEVEPVDSPAWGRARAAGRTAYYRELARLLDSEHQKQTIEGRDRKNVFLRRLRRPRRGEYRGAPGRPLNPWRELSRVNKNRRWHVSEKGCRLYWVGRVERRRQDGSKTSISVQRLMAAHGRRQGEFVRGAPTRDVLGLAPVRVERAVAEARKWWARKHPGDRRPKERKPPETIGGIPARQIPAAARPMARKYPLLAEYLVPPDKRAKS